VPAAAAGGVQPGLTARRPTRPVYSPSPVCRQRKDWPVAREGPSDWHDEPRGASRATCRERRPLNERTTPPCFTCRQRPLEPQLCSGRAQRAPLCTVCGCRLRFHRLGLHGRGKGCRRHAGGGGGGGRRSQDACKAAAGFARVCTSCVDVQGALQELRRAVSEMGDEHVRRGRAIELPAPAG